MDPKAIIDSYVGDVVGYLPRRQRADIARELRSLLDDELGSVPAPCIVPRVVGRSTRVPHSGPAVGQHNDEVYGQLGLGAAELAVLRNEGVI